MEKLKVEYIDTGELKPYENNAKIHTDAQIEQLGRSCMMMEYDPHYADVIIDRWEKFTGKTAEKVNDDDPA